MTLKEKEMKCVLCVRAVLLVESAWWYWDIYLDIYTHTYIIYTQSRTSCERGEFLPLALLGRCCRGRASETAWSMRCVTITGCSCGGGADIIGAHIEWKVLYSMESERERARGKRREGRERRRVIGGVAKEGRREKTRWWGGAKDER